MTQLATKVKLAVGVPAITIVVTEAVEVEGNYGPQARITGTTGDGEIVTLYEKFDAVTRQLSRLGLGIADAVGRTLSFWKEEAQNAAGQTFPALRIAGVVHEPPVPAKAFNPASRTAKQPISDGGPLPFEETGAPPASTATGDDFARLVKLHARCLAAAAVNLSNQRIDTLNGDIAGAVTAAGATLFIQANLRGIK